MIDEDFQVQIETNGTLPPPPGFPASVSVNKLGAWVVVSPKAARVHPSTEGIAVAWKYVLSHDSIDSQDGLPICALDHSVHRRVARPPREFLTSAIYLQPADAQDLEINLKNRKSVVESCMKHGYTLQLQLHKILHLE